jgi:tRNA uridine 5-carboxymethylaminomethyl modification enzyme
MSKEFDVIVIGGGHAGMEAATAAARVGAKTALISISANNIGEMSCNPAIGGLGKGHIVKEIDALDGVMGRIIDKAGIHFKILNASKGPAVQGPRAQADRKLYKKVSHETIAEYKTQYGLEVIYATVENIIVENNKTKAVVLEDGTTINTKAVVLTTGTFLNGVIHIGKKNYPGGRYGDKPSIGLSKFLKEQNFEVGRLKTGTPARLNGKTINWSILEKQDGDNPPTPFSFLNTKIDVPQISCYITQTNEKTHEVIRQNIKESAMYSGNISGVGPRYCPSIEDKVVRFADKSSHQIFLEPEGLDDDTVYPNGISTSLPDFVQDAFIRSMKGLENVEILRYGYAIEYDYVNPQELKNTLETKKLNGLFLAGQINGTTGYEEAAGQGLVAGTNAAIFSKGSTNWFEIKRDEGYIGVMIDDLIHQGVSEPYRMFSSRAEYRMFLRADNADFRLTKKGYDYNLVSQYRYDVFNKKYDEVAKYKNILQNIVASPNQIKNNGIYANQDGVKRTGLQWLSFSNIGYDDLIFLDNNLKNATEEVRNIVSVDAKYEHYLKKQLDEIKLFRKDENLEIPEEIMYAEIDGLSAELTEKFSKIKPKTIGAALRIRGATPSSAIAILAHIRKLKA